jgi:hypothetical protein
MEHAISGANFTVRPSSREVVFETRIDLQKSGIFDRMSIADGVVEAALDHRYRATFKCGPSFTDSEVIDSLTNAFAGVEFSLPGTDGLWENLNVRTVPDSRFIGIEARCDISQVYPLLAKAESIYASELDGRYKARLWYGEAFSEQEALEALERKWHGDDSLLPLPAWESAWVISHSEADYMRLSFRVDLEKTKLLKKLGSVDGIARYELASRYSARFWVGSCFSNQEVLEAMKTRYEKFAQKANARAAAT